MALGAKNKRAVVLGLAALAVGGMLPVASATTPTPNEDVSVSYERWAVTERMSRPAPQLRAQRLEDRYLVTFAAGTPKDTVTAARREAEAAGAETYYRYSRAVRGFAAVLNETALYHLRRNATVVSIEPDYSISVAETPPAPGAVPTVKPQPGTAPPAPAPAPAPPAPAAAPASSGPASTTQSDPANWGLDRIDQHSLPLNRTYSYAHTGEGVTAYIIDTGVRSTHRELLGRVGEGFGAIDDGNGSEDCNGHGTHVAGVVAGNTFGVAKKTKIVSVRVLDCEGSGTISGVVAGVDWVTKNHKGPAIANMSLGGVVSDTLDEAVENSIEAGVIYTVAAGNEGEAACSYSPARIDRALTVGAVDITDRRSDFSNFGQCVDLFAPGEDIRSADGTGDTATQVLSGTSMASPHVAGVIAQYLQVNPKATTDQVRAALMQVASTNVLSGIGAGSPNRLLFSLLDNSTPVDSLPTMLPPRVGLSPDGSGAGSGGSGAGGAAALSVALEPMADAATARRYELQRSGDGATWAPVALPTATARAVGIQVPPGPLTLRVRAIDQKGVAGPWATAPVAQVTLLGPGQATVYSPASAWADTPRPGATSVMASDRAAATATFAFTGTQFAWFSGRSTSGGRASVMIDGKLVATIDLSNLPAAARRVAFLSDVLTRGRHTVVIRVLSAPVGKAAHAQGVDVDGWATLS